MGTPSADTRSRVRRYYLFQILVAFQIWSPFWSLWLFVRLENDYFQATLVDVVFWGVSLLVAVPAGAIADRYGRKPALVLGVAIWLSGIVLFGLSTTFVTFALSNMVWAFGAGFMWGTGSAYLYDTLSEVQLEQRYPLISSRVAMLSFLGTGAACLLGGFLVTQTGGLQVPLLVYIVPGAAAVAVAWSFQEPQMEREPEPNLFAQIRSGWRTTARNRQILLVIAFQVVVGLVTYVMAFFRSRFMANVVQNDYVLMGSLYFGFFVIAAFAGLAAEPLLRGLGESGCLALVFLLVFPPFVLVFLVSQGFFPGGLNLGLGTLSQVFDYSVWGLETPLITTILNRRVGSHDRATVLAINSFFGTLVILVAEPAVGAVATDYNFGLGLAALALVCAFPAAYAIAAFRRTERTEVAPASAGRGPFEPGA